MWVLPEVGDNRTWVPAREAAKLLKPLYQFAPQAWGEIIAHAAGDLIGTRCAKYRVEEDFDDDILDRLQTGVSGQFWRHHRAGSRSSADWNSGRFTVSLRAESGIGRQAITLFGVEFCEEDIRAAFNLPRPNLSVFPVGALQSADPGQTWLSEMERVTSRPGLAVGRGGAESTLPEIETEAETAPLAKAARAPPKRNAERKVPSGVPFVPDDQLTKWYERHYAQHPDDVYRVVKPKADKRFQPKFKVGKNQLYDVMRSVQNGLRVGKR